MYHIYCGNKLLLLLLLTDQYYIVSNIAIPLSPIKTQCKKSEPFSFSVV